MDLKISVVINTLNEAKLLPQVITSVNGLADEIVVVDMESDDNTVKIAKDLGAKVFAHKRLDYVEPARNFAISKASGDWVLILDPDEEIPTKLRKKIKEVIQNNNFDYYRIPRKNIVFGKWLKNSRWWPDYNIRLFRKGSVSWNEIIHTVPMTQGNGVEIEAEEDLAIIHHHYDSIEQYITRMDRYTSQQLKVLLSKSYKFSWVDLISKPTNEFLSRYFFGMGYKDGVHGLAVSLLQSFSELILYLKVWQYSKFKSEDVGILNVVSEMNLLIKDLHFWQNDAVYKETGNIGARIKRKLRI